MKRLAWIAAVDVLIAVPLQAKGVTTLVEIQRPGMPTLRVADATVRQFNIFEGPGTVAWASPAADALRRAVRVFGGFARDRDRG